MPLADVYQSEARFLEHLQLQDQNIDQYQTEVGATAAEKDQIKEDAAAFEFLIETCNAVDEYKKAAFAIKAQFFSNKTEPPVGAFVTAPTITAPPILAGAVKRSRELDQRFLHSAGITEAAKVALDLIGPESDAPVDVKPTFEAHAAQMNFLFSVVTQNRGQADMWEVWARPKGGDWAVVGSATGKSSDFTYAAGGDDPVVVDLRIQLKKNNENYGILSDIVSITLNP
jgi:hypothetical protein